MAGRRPGRALSTPGTLSASGSAAIRLVSVMPDRDAGQTQHNRCGRHSRTTPGSRDVAPVGHFVPISIEVVVGGPTAPRGLGSVSRSVTVGRGASRPASSVTGRLSAARGELESSRHMPGSARLCERFDGPGQPPDAIRSRLRSADDLGSFLVFAVRAVGRAGAAGTVHHQASAERAGQDGNEQLKRPHRAPARKFDHVPGDGSKACHLRGQRPRPDPDALLSLVCPAADIPPRSLPRPPST